MVKAEIVRTILQCIWQSMVGIAPAFHEGVRARRPFDSVAATYSCSQTDTTRLKILSVL